MLPPVHELLGRDLADEGEGEDFVTLAGECTQLSSSLQQEPGTSHDPRGAENIVLVLAGTELNLFLVVAGTVLCFGFSVRILLITL